MMLVWHHAFSLDLNITLNNAGDLINQVDVSKLDEVESLTIAGDLNGTDILVIRKMVNLKTLDMENANIVNGGSSYYEDFTTSENAIGEYFFIDKSNIVTIILPKSVTFIGHYSFSGCSKLTNVIIPNGVTTIGIKAFANCSSLPSISIPESVTYIEKYAFEGCLSLENVRLEDGIKEIIYSDFPFSSCPIKTLYIGREMSWSAPMSSPFSDITTLENVELGRNVSTIGTGAFGGCMGLVSITIPNWIREIKVGAFSHCI